MVALLWFEDAEDATERRCASFFDVGYLYLRFHKIWLWEDSEW